MPVVPQEWHYRQSIDYEMTQNRAILDLASRYRETFLFNIWRMGMNSIENGSKDQLDRHAQAHRGAGSGGGGCSASRGAAADAADVADAAAALLRRQRRAAMSRRRRHLRRLGARILPAELYNTILHDPKLRDPRGYIIPSDQADFATATEFVNALLKNGITIHRATAAFTVAGKSYPAGSYVVKTAQAFRPHVLDMFEPQDHPNDFAYPGGPPKPPYDITGWTLAMQMGVQFDRVLDGFDGPVRQDRRAAASAARCPSPGPRIRPAT